MSHGKIYSTNFEELVDTEHNQDLNKFIFELFTFVLTLLIVVGQLA